ncbi:hypothetical protein [Phycicoccus sp.]|uniref:hypothetical protein n=1 Tax=Phycicoccus sp. TaxID=1902410 RepID=UPI002B5363DA|nr:hypothetical protein [Phycicoccus sp.]HMM96715.1 hypothetical protein [Phycicoccus sp.]
MSLSPDQPSDLRAGNVRRYVTERDVDGLCECGRRFSSTGTAASHARSARHSVRVTYWTRFEYVPLEAVAKTS